MIRQFLYVVFILVIVGLPSLVSAATIYTNSTTGDDSTGDGTSGAPYATFHKAYTEAAASGDTVDLTGTFDWTDADETGDSSETGYALAKSLTIQGQGQASTFIQASSTENTADRRVFTVNSGKTVVISNVTIRYGVSTASESAGGIKNSGNLTIKSSTISYNRYNSTSNYYGAGAIDLPNSANSTLTIATSTISNNTFDGKWYGSGGIFAGQSNTIIINDSTIANNTSISSAPTTFAYSYAEPSGAIGVFRFVYTTITNSTISNNTTNSYGGALQVYYPYYFKITNSTIANNNADAGAGGILFESVTDGYSIHMKNTILANNTGNGSDDDFHAIDTTSGGRVTDNGYNIVEFSTNKTWSGTGNITGDQTDINLSATLADNSATNGVQTLALTTGSVAIDAGDTVANSSVVVPTYDERGGTRADTIDIGAFELGATGIVDATVPTVSLTAPTSAQTVGGASVSLSANASDNVAVAGVSFYVDSTLQGVEDTSSPYAVTWDSTATSTGSHSGFAVARDTSNNYATSTTISFTVDNTAPVVSAVAVATTSSTATITWTTDEAGSTLVNFGLTSSYGTSTTEVDTSTRVTSHSAVLYLLRSCTLYHYQVTSNDASSNAGTSSDGTFTTTGCTGDAVISATSVGSIATSTGGTLSRGNLTLTVPTSYTATSSSAVFEAHEISSTDFYASAGRPTGLSEIGSGVYRLSAYSDATTTLSTFDSALTITLTYTSSDIVGIDETSLLIYRYDGSTWDSLSNCTIDTSAKTVTCETTTFSDFALFGTLSTASAASNVESSSGGGTMPYCFGPLAPGWNVDLPNGGCSVIEQNFSVTNTSVLASTHAFENLSTTSVAHLPTSELVPFSTTLVSQLETPYTFTRTLRAHMEGEDVLELQKFLNEHGFVLAAYGNGAPGYETNYFGPLTYNALVKFQEAYASEILTPLDITHGTGICAELSRAVINEFLR